MHEPWNPHLTPIPASTSHLTLLISHIVGTDALAPRACCVLAPGIAIGAEARASCVSTAGGCRKLRRRWGSGDGDIALDLRGEGGHCQNSNEQRRSHDHDSPDMK